MKKINIWKWLGHLLTLAFFLAQFLQALSIFPHRHNHGYFWVPWFGFLLILMEFLAHEKSNSSDSFTLFIFLPYVTGVIYPLLVTGISQVFFPNQSNGSLIEHNDVSVGSELIGQNFTSDAIFLGKTIATSSNPYNAFDQESLTGSSGSNFGPLSQSLFDSDARTN